MSFSRDEQKFDGKQSVFFPPRLLRGGESACLRQVSVYLHTEEVCVMGGVKRSSLKTFLYSHPLYVSVCVRAGAVSVTTWCKHTGAETRASPFRMRAALTSVHAVSGPIFPARTLTSKHTNISKHRCM